MDSGRAVLIVTPEGKSILIDGGRNAEILRRLSSLVPFYKKEIYMVIDRGGDADKKDFSEGLKDVLDRYKTIEMISPTELGMSGGDVVYKEGGKEELEIRVVFPRISRDGVDGFKYSKGSPPSVVIELGYGCCKYILLGNASPSIQGRVADDIDMDGVVLVEMSHSGSTSNMSKSLKSEVDRVGEVKWIPYNKKSPDRTFFSDGQTFWESM